MFNKLFDLLNKQERKRVVLLLIMILTMGLLDMLGVVSIMPFMMVLANPELLETNKYLNTAYEVSTAIGIKTTEQFLFLLGVVVFVLMVTSLTLKALTTYAQLRFSRMSEFTIGKRLIEIYLHQPYSWFLSRNSADLGKNILSEVGVVIGGGMTPAFTIIAQGTVSMAILLLLILIDINLAFVVGLTLATSYLLIYKVSRRLLNRIGSDRLKANQGRYTAVSEAFGASKEVKVGGLEEIYVQRYSNPAYKFAHYQATSLIIGQLPRFALEAITFGGMLLVVLYLLGKSGSFASAIPTISLYAFAGYRLMPAMQQIYAAVASMRYAAPAINALHAELMSLQSDRPYTSESKQATIEFKCAITLNQINYRYPNAPHLALKNVSFTISAKSTIGLVGVTGSGKTTTVDLILGLLEAQQGTLEVDGVVITEHNRRSWQQAIGYVPQQIYLADDTVAANIAFGIQAENIDSKALERAAQIANLHEFVVNELPQQYKTIVGERGVRLSGGQRQRIGIARALYHQPQVLILDEATSALDNLTEQYVMKAVENLEHEITIILIAHRLSTVKKCNQIVLLEHGEIKDIGTYEELAKRNEQFGAMTKAQ